LYEIETASGNGTWAVDAAHNYCECIWWLFTIALLAAYIANFTALLSSGSEQLSIQTFEDLVKQRKLEFGTLDGSSTFYFFKVQKI